jgi:prepilin-type processing-associated H-X9-DG protein
MIAPRVVEPDQETQTLHVTWADGHVSAIAFGTLRDHCPCARCKDDRDKHRQQLRMALTTKLLSWKRIGNYALNFSWGDSHDDGFFTYDYLRALCPCPDCAPSDRV